ncbi:hypothetical protein AB8P60_20610, partial [Yersinia proxima]
IIQSVNTLTLNAIHVINNNTNESKESAVIFSSEGIEINATTIENKNGAALASDGDISLVAKTINNNSSVISANNMSLTASEFNNSNGQVDTISDLLIKLTNYFNNNSGSIFSGNKLSLGLSGNAGNYTYNESSGDLNAKSHFDLNVTGSIIIDRILETAADLFLSADGNIDNNSSVLSLGDLSLKAKDITNKAGSLLFSKSDINIDARNGSFINENNANVLSMNNMAIHAKNIKNNAGTIRSEGDMALDAQLIENTSNYDNPGWVAGPSEVASSSVDWCAGIFCTTKYYFKLDGGIPTWVGNLQLNSMAEISANGNLYINQKKDISYAGPELKNKGGIIQSRKDMVISGNVYNSPEVNEKSFYEYLTGSLSKPIVLE